MSPLVDPYFTPGGIPTLKQSVFVIADILGFSDEVDKAFADGSQHELLEILFSILMQGYSTLDDPSKVKWRLKVYSDNLILGLPFLGSSNGGFEFLQACSMMANYQLDLATRGYYLRGGIGVGKLHISERIVFSDRFREMKEADEHCEPPRVVLLESAVDHLLKIGRPAHLGRFIGLDSKREFVNYLGILDPAKDKRQGLQVIQHKLSIEQQLKDLQGEQHRGSIIDKYIWLANYHNTFCLNSNSYNSAEYFVGL